MSCFMDVNEELKYFSSHLEKKTYCGSCGACLTPTGRQDSVQHNSELVYLTQWGIAPAGGSWGTARDLSKV